MIQMVTLHVSVWVEMEYDEGTIEVENGHAPRERVSWNCKLDAYQQDLDGVTLHVSVWVEISVVWIFRLEFLSRSTWACELKCDICKERNGKIYVTLHVSVWVEML